MMTLTASATLIMSSHHHRWLTRKEMLSLQGIPVTTEFTGGTPTNSFALRWLQESEGQEYFPWPGRATTCAQAGNAMHVSNAGMAILFAMTQTILDPGMLSLQQMLMRRRAHLGVQNTLSLVPLNSEGGVSGEQSEHEPTMSKRPRLH